MLLLQKSYFFLFNYTINTLPTWFRASSIVHFLECCSHQVVLKAFTILESHYWNLKRRCKQSLKFLQYVSDILKCWIIIDVKSKLTFRSSVILSFKKAIPRRCLPERKKFCVLHELENKIVLGFWVQCEPPNGFSGGPWAKLLKNLQCLA